MSIWGKGVGYISAASGKKGYYIQYLERATITRKEYTKFRAVFEILDLKKNEIAHKMSVVEKICLKYNKVP